MAPAGSHINGDPSGEMEGKPSLKKYHAGIFFSIY